MILFSFAFNNLIEEEYNHGEKGKPDYAEKNGV